MKGIKKFFEPVDMTVGKPWKSILTFSVPMVIGNIAQQLYATVDSIIIGQSKWGDNGLAAVGSATPLFNLLLVLFVGISAGVGIMISQYFGARSSKDLSKTIGTCITVTAISSLFIMIVIPPFVRTMLKLLGTPPEILEQCRSYLVIMMYGVSGMAYYNILSGVLRGMGDSFSSLIYLLVATVLNIFLDLLFVEKYGVAGVATATIIAQFASSALCFYKLFRMKQYYTLTPKELKISSPHLKQLVKLGIPSGVTQAIFSSAMIVIQSLTNSFGAQFIAANVIVMRVDGFAMMPNFSFGTAMTTYAGQNIGAGRLDRVKDGSKQGTLIAVATSTFITMVILILGRWLISIFTDTQSLVDLSVYNMRILAAGYIAMAVTQSLSGVMRGAGDTMTPMWISICTSVIIRIPIAYLIRNLTITDALPTGRSECIQISLLLSWIMGAVLTAIAYRIGKWKNKSVVTTQ